MKETILLFAMLFCHIVDDYYLQGWLASAKQKSWWEKNCPKLLYKHDYIAALIEHAFSWTFMIHLPLIVLMIVTGKYITSPLFVLLFAVNWVIHAITDDAKANKMLINLIQDQLIHVSQIFLTWAMYVCVINTIYSNNNNIYHYI